MKKITISLIVCFVLVFITPLLSHDGSHVHNQANSADVNGQGDLFFTEKINLPGYNEADLGRLEYPSVAIDNNRNLYVAYNYTPEEGREAVYLNTFNISTVRFNESYRDTPDNNLLEIVKHPEWREPLQVSAETGVEYRPGVAVTSDNVVWVVWSARRNQEWNIFARVYVDGELGEEMQLTGNQGYNFRPVIFADNHNRVWVAWERGTDDKHIHIIAKYYSEGEWSQEILIEDRPGYSYRPVILDAPNGAVWFAWDYTYTHSYTTNIFIRSFENGNLRSPVQVSHHPAIDSKAALSWFDDKLWIAWTTNRRGEDGWGIIRYPMVRAFDGKTWFEPVSEIPGIDLFNREETQSYEFPTLTFDRFGRMYLFNRHDHQSSAIYYDGDAWSDHMHLDEPGWGIRGIYVHLAWESDNELWMARRDRTTIYLQKIIRDSREIRTPQIRDYIPVSYPSQLQGIAGDSFRGPTSSGNFNVYYGDIHVHTAYSDGSGSFDEVFNLYRNVYRVDFIAITEHDAMGGTHYSPGAWAYLKALNEIYYRPGEFVTINAYEWTHSTWMGRQDSTVRTGHKNVYFKGGEESPLFSHRGTVAFNAETLFETLRSHDAIAIPHHPPWGGITWDDHDPEIQTNYEIVSIHGASEYMGNLPIPHRGGMPGSFAQNGLANGHVFGFVGGSDTHGLYYHSDDGWREDPYKGGLTGVLLNGSLTRENVWDALKNRRNYATSGEKYFLNFSVNGAPMGSEITVDEPPAIHFEARSLNILYCYIIRNNEELFITGSIGAGRFGYRGLKDETIEPGMNYYYLRVVYKDGTVAWSSPIWVNYLSE